jgi:hypothetical protein
MNKGTILWLTLCFPVILFSLGCQSPKQELIPITGDVNSPAPEQIKLARDNVLEYIISSSRLADIPGSAEWQLDIERQVNGQYFFHSGNWLMIVWAADADNENKQVVIHNKAENIFWCGYVKPNGQVKDTSYTR